MPENRPTFLSTPGSLILRAVLVTSLMSFYAGFGTPDVNESHYLTKAKHFWDPKFAPGDLFLESGDAHWFFFVSYGWLTQWLSLPLTAWIGRILGWFFMAWGWCAFAEKTCRHHLWAGPITAPLWLAGLHWGNLSGEWVVGGFEAKVLAYGCSFFGLAEIASNRWSRAWVWFGTASAFHVLTGGWITLSAMICYCIWRWMPFRSDWKFAAVWPVPVEPLKCQWLPLMTGGCLALLGLVPAVVMNRGVAIADNERGYILYVYQRLAHHLSPLHFASERWWQFTGLVALTLAFAAMAWRIKPPSKMANSDDRSLTRFIGLATWISAFAVIGFVIDLSLSSWATNWAASLLRFYWFRWNDVVWPTLLAVLAYRIAFVASDPAHEGVRRKFRFLAMGLLFFPGSALLVIRSVQNSQADLPPADRALVFRHETDLEKKRVRDDWLDVCYWVRANTPTDSLLLTPRFQQTFKWYAHRAEIVSWKDAPQDTQGLIEWDRRMLSLFPRTPEGYSLPMTLEHLKAMHTLYRMDYVILDRRLQKTPPLLPLLHSNTTYAVFEYPKRNMSNE